ncbi:hypothetical protein L1987_76320 [Smallanthus sonchifolius]|uniref:Uncharacterized protein n=1 Tax=Smallanthus sonchifolius TaxID=185202 RepID=A0ACB9A7F6_9ASTR|nr:hypothetical protein L1987_76320 [Smallanthus sonchifolius]
MKPRSRRMIPFHAIDMMNTDDPSMLKLRSPFDQEETYQDFNIAGSFNASGTIYAYGFGYGTTADDLKIVRLRNHLSAFQNCMRSLVLKHGHGADLSGTITFVVIRARLQMDFCTGFQSQRYCQCRRELWVMKEHGLGKTWSMVCLLESVFGSSCILDDGKLLILTLSEQLVIYDMFKDSYKEVNALMSFRQLGSWLQAVEYVESSISPSGICSV